MGNIPRKGVNHSGSKNDNSGSKNDNSGSESEEQSSETEVEVLGADAAASSNSDSESEEQKPRKSPEEKEDEPGFDTRTFSVKEISSKEGIVRETYSEDKISISLNCPPCSSFRVVRAGLILGSLLILGIACLKHEQCVRVVGVGENTFLSDFLDSYVKPGFDKFQNITSEFFCGANHISNG